MWEFPGGKVEEGETPEQCLARELREEFELEAEIGEFITSARYRYREKRIELLAYEARLEPGEPILNSHDEIAWVPIGRLLDQDLAPADVPIARVLLQRS